MMHSIDHDLPPPFRGHYIRAGSGTGIYWLLDQHLSISDADRAHWARFLVKRRQFIDRVLAMVVNAAGTSWRRSH